MGKLISAVSKCDLDNVEKQLPDDELQIFYRARKWFYFCPEPLRLEPDWIPTISDIWSQTFEKLHDPNEWGATHIVYSEQVARAFETLNVTAQAGQTRLAARSSSRIWYYLTFLSGGMYLPTPFALELTADRLNQAGPGIVQVCIIEFQSALVRSSLCSVAVK